MLFLLIFTILSSVILSVWASSLLFKHCFKQVFGLIPLVMLGVVGVIMMLVFELFTPKDLTLEQYVITLYLSCVVYFVVQLNITYRIVAKSKSE